MPVLNKTSQRGSNGFTEAFNRLGSIIFFIQRGPIELEPFYRMTARIPTGLRAVNVFKP